MLKENEKKFVIGLAHEMRDAINHVFGSTIIPEDIHVGFKTKGSSYGGILRVKGKIKRGIKLNCYSYYPDYPNANYAYWEYKHIRDDAEIGEIRPCSWKRHMAALVAHEMAHVYEVIISEKNNYSKRVLNSPYFEESKVRFGYRDFYADTTKKRHGDHGEIWQACYRFLRNKFVNNGYADSLEIPKKKKKREYKKNWGKLKKGNRIYYYLINSERNVVVGMIEDSGCGDYATYYFCEKSKKLIFDDWYIRAVDARKILFSRYVNEHRDTLIKDGFDISGF